MAVQDVGSSGNPFFNNMAAHARTAAALTNIPFEVILAQWALESNYGKSDLAQRANNFAGIKYNTKADFKSGAYAGYNSIANFAKDYARVLNLSYYNAVRAASTIEQTIIELDKSPYAEDTGYADKLRQIVKQITGSPITDTSTSSLTMPNFEGLLKSPVVWLSLFVILLFK